MRRQQTKFVWYNNIGTKGEVYNNTGLPQKEKKIWNKQPNFIPRGTGERINGA